MENLKIKNLYQAYNGKNILDGISLELIPVKLLVL